MTNNKEYESSFWSNGDRLFHECKDLYDNNRGCSSTLCKMKLYTWDFTWRMDIIDQDDKFVARFEGNITTCPMCGVYLEDINEYELNKQYRLSKKYSK